MSPISSMVFMASLWDVRRLALEVPGGALAETTQGLAWPAMRCQRIGRTQRRFRQARPTGILVPDGGGLLSGLHDGVSPWRIQAAQAVDVDNEVARTRGLADIRADHLVTHTLRTSPARARKSHQRRRDLDVWTPTGRPLAIARHG